MLEGDAEGRKYQICSTIEDKMFFYINNFLSLVLLLLIHLSFPVPAIP